MTNTTETQALIDAVEAESVDHGSFNIEFISGDPRESGICGVNAHRAYDGSLDAAMALHNAVLPGWEFFISKEGKENEFFASVLNPRWTLGHSAHSSNPARAWLLAILRAMLTQK